MPTRSRGSAASTATPWSSASPVVGRSCTQVRRRDEIGAPACCSTDPTLRSSIAEQRGEPQHRPQHQSDQPAVVVAGVLDRVGQDHRLADRGLQGLLLVLGVRRALRRAAAPGPGSAGLAPSSVEAAPELEDALPEASSSPAVADEAAPAARDSLPGRSRSHPGPARSPPSLSPSAPWLTWPPARLSEPAPRGQPPGPGRQLTGADGELPGSERAISPAARSTATEPSATRIARSRALSRASQRTSVAPSRPQIRAEHGDVDRDALRCPATTRGPPATPRSHRRPPAAPCRRSRCPFAPASGHCRRGRPAPVVELAAPAARLGRARGQVVGTLAQGGGAPLELVGTRRELTQPAGELRRRPSRGRWRPGRPGRVPCASWLALEAAFWLEDAIWLNPS